RLVTQRLLAAVDIRPNAKGRLDAVHHEKVARALEAHLSSSGEYTYTLELARHDRHADPVVDFLCNVKRGHCERFASGLAVMLRAQGIPSRIVTGFRGAENQQNDRYFVRQNHAHSWVEALVRRTDNQGQTTWHWLTLDPTPSEDQQSTEASGWGR